MCSKKEKRKIMLEEQMKFVFLLQYYIPFL